MWSYILQSHSSYVSYSDKLWDLIYKLTYHTVVYLIWTLWFLYSRTNQCQYTGQGWENMGFDVSIHQTLQNLEVSIQWGYPRIIQVMDDHLKSLKQPWLDLGDPPWLKNPRMPFPPRFGVSVPCGPVSVNVCLSFSEEPTKTSGNGDWSSSGGENHGILQVLNHQKLWFYLDSVT